MKKPSALLRSYIKKRPAPDKITRLMYAFIIPALAASALIFAVSVPLSRVNTHYTYFYMNNTIYSFSWRTVFGAVTLILGLMAFVASVVIAVIIAVRCIKAHNKFFKKAVAVLFSGLVAVSLIDYANLAYIGLNTDSLTEPVCYEFTNGNHTLIIREESVPLAGSWEAYQLAEDGKTAYFLGEFATDDGGRNEGQYEIEWSDTEAVIHYRAFTTENSERTATVQFQD